MIFLRKQKTNKRSQTQISPYLNPQSLELAPPRLAYVIYWYARLGLMSAERAPTIKSAKKFLESQIS